MVSHPPGNDGNPQAAEVLFDGVSQVPALLGKGAPRDSFVGFFPHYASSLNIPSASIRSGPWKLIRYFGDGPDGEDRFALFNLDEDLGESENVAKSHMEVVETLSAEISTHLETIQAVVPQPNPNYDPKSKSIPYAPDGAKLRKSRTEEAKPKQENKRPKAKAIGKRDTNKDGSLSLKEYIGSASGEKVPALTRKFKQRDSNKDGKLTLQELK